MKTPALLSPLLLLAVACSEAPALDEDKLTALDAAYVEGWLMSDPAAQEEAVMALFSGDAVIMPGAGLDPREGADALRQFWFPPNSPPTNVDLFEHDITGVDVEGGLGVVSGRYRLTFEYDGAVYARDGNYQFVARRRANDELLITQMIWNDRALDQ